MAKVTQRHKAALPLAVLVWAVAARGSTTETSAETPRPIRVVMDNAYAPFAFQSDEGRLQGILVDQWRAWEKKTGLKADIYAMDWGQALRRMRGGEFDVIDCIVETDERRKYFDFTTANTRVEASIYFRRPIAGITDLASLRGFPVAVKAGDQHVDQLEANGVTTVIRFQSNDAIIEAAKQHKVNVFVVDDPSALYLLNKAGLDEEFRHSAPIFRDELKRAVRKGDAALLHTVSQGFAAIEPAELRRIEEKWFGLTVNRYARYLTYASYAAVAAAVLIAGLAGWNRLLRKGILQRTAALHALVERLQNAREEEAKRIARELHDDLGQQLTALSLELAKLERNLTGGASSPDQAAQIQRMHSVVDHTIGVVQEISSELRPGHLDVLGLTAAIEWQLTEFSRRSGIACRVTRLDEVPDLSDAQRTAVYRILQEALTNIARHAGATQAEVSLEAGTDRLALRIRDNGRGITAAERDDPHAIGLLGMRERAQIAGGDVTITGGAGFGTTVVVRIRVPPAAPRST
jgi:signal transduction histidine kinase